MEILAGLPAEYAQGIYATPGTHDALIRFSNGSPHAGADARLGTATGLALKIFDIDGPTLLEDEPDTGTFDYATINAPIFFCNTVEHYLFIQDLFLDAPAYFAQGRPGAHRFFREFVTGKGTLDQDDWAWDEFLAFLTPGADPPGNLLLSTLLDDGRGPARRLHRQGAHRPRPGTSPTRWSAAPSTSASAPEVFRPALVAELQERPYAFDIQVQLCADLERMPVEDVTVEWPEQLSPFVTVARLRLPAAGHLRPGQPGEDGRAVLHALAGHRRARAPGQHHAGPQGGLPPLLHLRHKLNQQPRTEPRSADEVLVRPTTATMPGAGVGVRSRCR